MPSTRLRPSALSLTDQHTVLRVTYSVVVTADDGARHVLAREQESTIHVDDAIDADVQALFTRVGRRMEQAIGLAAGDDAPTEPLLDDEKITDREL